MQGIHPDTRKTASFARRLLCASLLGLASSLSFVLISLYCMTLMKTVMRWAERAVTVWLGQARF